MKNILSHNIKTFMDNPMGKGSGAFQIKSVKEAFEKRYKKITKEKNKKVKIVNVCIEKERYFVHYKIPSESERTNDYDVIIEFYDPKREHTYEAILKNYSVRFFSNCPSFTYTFANIYQKNALFIPEFKTKYPKEVFAKKPIERNPYQIVNFDKSIFFAVYHILSSIQYTTKSYLDEIENIKFMDLLNKIRNCDQIQMEIAKENTRLKDKKRREALDKSKEVKKVISDKHIAPKKKTTSGTKNGKIVGTRGGTIKSSVKRIKGR